MSFAMLVRDHFKNTPDAAEQLDKAFLRLQVLLAYADGHLSNEERMTLSLLSLGRSDERESKSLIDDLVTSIEAGQFEAQCDRILDEVRKLTQSLPDMQRQKLALDVVRESLTMIVADEVVSPKEREFIVARLAPGLDIPVSFVEPIVTQAEQNVDLVRRFFERAFEIYLMIIDACAAAPALNSPPGRHIQGFLGAVDRLVLSHRLQSSRATTYFLGGWCGLFWAEDYERHCAALGRLSARLREVIRTTGPAGRLQAIGADLDQLISARIETHAYPALARHVINALGRLESVNDGQRIFFEEHVVPALRIDITALRRTAAARPSLANLHCHLSGTAPSIIPPKGSACDDPRRWWEFWR